MNDVKRALITGGSRGIGFAIASKLITENVSVCITGKNGERLDAAVQILTELKHSLHNSALICSVQADLEHSETPGIIAESAAEQLGGIDLLVNNAGISLSAAFSDTTENDWDRIMQINAKAPFFICQKALPWLRKSKLPTIIQIASVVSYKGYELQSAYSASKHALLGFTKAIAKEVQEDDIRVYTLSPGGVATDMVTSVRPDIDKSELISPEEIADLIYFIITHRGNAMIDHFSIRRASKTAWS